MHNNWHLANSYLSNVTHIAEAPATATPQKKKKKNSIILFYKFVQLEFYFVQLVIFKSIHLNTFFFHSNANVRFLTTKKNHIQMTFISQYIFQLILQECQFLQLRFVFKSYAELLCQWQFICYSIDCELDGKFKWFEFCCLTLPSFQSCT